MNVFGQLMSKLLGKKPSPEGPIPGAMGRLLADMGIHELGPVQKGTPLNVLQGCKQELVVIPGTDRPATRKDGTPIYSKDKRGQKYLVMDQYAVPKKQWKAMQQAEKRKAAGRWYSGKPMAEAT